MPAAYPLAVGDVVLRQPLGMLSAPGVLGSALEIIRFAAANRLTVEIDYIKEDGERTTREIEAYSLRRTKAGQVVLHGFDMNRNDHRSYRSDRIGGARPTSRTFNPRYAVELTPSGTQSIPPTARGSSSSGGFGGGFGGGLGRGLGRALGSTGRASRIGFGSTYVYECPFCSKKFTRKTQDTVLRPHMTPDGWDCSGRAGYLVDVR